MLGTAPASQAEYKLWPAADINVTVSVAVDIRAALELGDRVLQGVKALPRRGLEIGGLLLGSQSSGEIRIDSLFPIASEYPEGPAYRVPVETLNLAVSEAESVAEIVGIYRSRTDGRVEMDEQDRSLLGLISRGENSVVLLLRQTKDVPAQANVAVGKGLDLGWIGNSILFADWIRGVQEEEPKAKENPAETALVDLKVEQKAPSLSERYPRISGLARQLMVPVLAVARYEPPISKRAQLGVIASLAAAGISITAYLEYLDKSEITAPSAEVQKARVPLPGTDLPIPAAVPDRVEPVPPMLPLPVITQTAKSELKPRQADSVGPRTSEPEQTRTRTVRKAFTPPPANRAAVPNEPAAIAAPPQISPAISSATPAPHPPPSATSLEHVAPPATSVDFKPPVLARQPKNVVLPPDLRRLLKHEVSLAVRVGVDAGGKVNALTSLDRLDNTEQLVWRAYASAIKSWEFEPATRNGSPVAADTILRFRVSPSAQ